MYSQTASRPDVLTLKAPYPSCYEKKRPDSFIHLDEFAFKVRTTFARDKRGGKALPPFSCLLPIRVNPRKSAAASYCRTRGKLGSPVL
jgi:hypothetical protein